MLTLSLKNQIVERLVTDRYGRKALVTFLLTETAEGGISVSVISAKPIAADSAEAAAQEPILLAGATSLATTPRPSRSRPQKVISPYISLDFLFTSQPTRAPSLA